MSCLRHLPMLRYTYCVKKQPSQDVLHGDAAEEELGLAHLVSSYTLPHRNLHVAIPPMVGPTWLRVAYSLGSDYVLVVVPEDLPRGLLVVACVISYVPVGCVSCHVSLPSCRCLCTILSDSAVIWGCVCTYCRLVIMRVGVRLHGTSYPMTDCVLYLGWTIVWTV